MANKKKTTALLLVLVIFTALVTVLSLCCGSVWLGWRQLLSPGTTARNILYHVRIPRTLAAILAGGALAIAGATVQDVLSNEMASPSVIGINAGAGFFMALCCALFPAKITWVSLFAFLGALVAAMLILGLSWKMQVSRLTLVLAGLAISQIFSAGTDLIITLVPDALVSYSSFRIGSLAQVSLLQLTVPAILIGVSLVVLFLCSPELELLSTGQTHAQAFGLNTKKWSLILLLLAAVLSGSVVSFAGMIGFIGLLIPNLMRSFHIENKRIYLLCCFFAGSLLLGFSDLLARTIAAPYEIPVGILLSFCGGPYFLWLIFHQKRKHKKQFHFSGFFKREKKPGENRQKTGASYRDQPDNGARLDHQVRKAKK